MDLIDRWKRRYWRPDAAAIAALPGRNSAVVITGGSDGIGRALAEQFLTADQATVLIARDETRLNEARATLSSGHHRKIYTLSLDITENNAPAQIREFLASHDLYADVLINSAGVGVSGEFVEDSQDRLERLNEVNVIALTRLCRAFLPDMLVRGRGGMLNVSSLGGFAPGPYQAAYYASKAYVISLTYALAHETRGQGVRVATLAPGPVNTEFHARARGETALYRQILPALSADRAAASGRRGFDWGHTVIIPGFFNHVMGLAMRLLPAMVVMPIVAILLKPRTVRN